MDLKEIIADITNETCVLILGPDLVDFGEQTFFEAMCADLASNAAHTNIIDNAPQYIFANEELVQLMPSAKETTVLRMMREFYEKQTMFDEPLTKISQIPFHLIISLMPDDRLSKLFDKQHLPYSYDHYRRERPHGDVEKPLKEKPLIYNLLGDFNEYDATITFDHMFSFLAGIMGNSQLPKAIQEALKKAGTFVFLGVNFEKWNAQLLLRIITSKDKKDKFTIHKNRKNTDVCTFIARRLELDFVNAEPMQFLDSLYDQCRSKDLLKTTRHRKKIKIFLSYNHSDKTTVRTIKDRLTEQGLEVVMDESNMRGGEKIEEFINSIRDVDIVVPVLSYNSMLSPWVSREIITTIDKTTKHLYPCYLDTSFLDKSFEATAKSVVSEKVKALNQMITERGVSNTEDLDFQKRNLTEYYVNLPKILGELAGRKCISLMPEDFDNHIGIIAQDIKQLVKIE